MATPSRFTIRKSVAMFQSVAPIYDGRYPSSVRPASINVPIILNARALDQSGSVYRVLNNSETLALASLPDPFNIEANSSNSSGTGSVRFVLVHNSTEIVNRVDNNYPFTLFDSVIPVLDEGSYTLTITPYSNASGSGDAGIPHVLSFSVVDDRIAPAMTSQIAKGQAGFCRVTDGVDCSAISMYTAVVSNATGPITYQWSINSPDFTFVGSVNQTECSLQTLASSHKSAILTCTASDGATTLQTTLSIYHVHTNFGTGTEGFTDTPLSSGKKILYVSASGAGDGLTEGTATSDPYAAFSAMNAGDHVYFKRGDTFNNVDFTSMPNGVSSSVRTVLGYYGSSGARPVFSNINLQFHKNGSSRPPKYWAVKGVELYNPTKDPLNTLFAEPDPDSPNYDENLAKGNPTRFYYETENVLFEDVRFNFAGLTLQSVRSGVQAIKHFDVRRCIFTGVWDFGTSYTRTAKPSNVFTHETGPGLWEENVLDYGGWHPDILGAGGNMLSHGLYFQYGSDGDNTIFRNNIVCRSGSHGIQMRAGGWCDNNFFARNAVCTQMGYV